MIDLITFWTMKILWRMDANSLRINGNDFSTARVRIIVLKKLIDYMRIPKKEDLEVCFHWGVRMGGIILSLITVDNLALSVLDANNYKTEINPK